MAAATEDSRAGQVLGDYRLLEAVDSDATSDAYRATETRGTREVLIKVLRPEFALQSSVVQRFVSGPRAFSALTHPNVGRVLAVESDDTGIPYVVEERVVGQPLSQLLAGFPDGMPLGVAMNLLPPVVEAVDAAHQQGIVHGCIDADHVVLALVDGSTVPKVIGFGGLEDGRCRAPEVVSGGARDTCADVWSLGALIYQALSGQAPTAATGEPRQVALDELAPHLPGALTSLVGQCLMRDPRARVESDSLTMQLNGLRKRLSGVGHNATGLAQRHSPARMPLRREPTGPIEQNDPFAKKALPSAPPAGIDAAIPGLPPMRPPPALGGVAPQGRRRENTSPTLLGLPSMRPPEAQPTERGGGTKIRTGFRDRIETPLPPPRAPAPLHAPAPDTPGASAPSAPTAAGSSEESSFADLGLDDAESSFADVSLDEDDTAATVADESSFADVSLDDTAATVADESSFADVSLDDGDLGTADTLFDPDAQGFDLEAHRAAQAQAASAARRAPGSGSRADPGLGATMPDRTRAPATGDDDDEPEIELGGDDGADDDDPDGDPGATVARKLQERSERADLKTLSSLANAFGPLDGEGSVGQAETAERAAAPAADPTAPERGFLARSEKAKQEQAERRRVAQDEREKRKSTIAAAATLATTTAAKPSAPREAPAGIASVHMEKLRKLGREEHEPPYKRVTRALILLLFCLGLLFLMPMLIDPTEETAKEMFGARGRVVGAGFAVLSVISLIQLWSVQLRVNPPLIKPVTLTMQVVTACICVIGLTFFLPRGSLGPVGYAARWTLPWGAGLFFMFFGIFGLMSALRSIGQNALMAILSGILYLGALAGSYKVMMETVVKDMLAERLERKAVELDEHDGARPDTTEEEEGKGALARGKLDARELTEKLTDPNRDPSRGTRVGDRKLAGADEASDMEAIEELHRSRQRSAEQTEDLKQNMPNLVR